MFYLIFWGKERQIKLSIFLNSGVNNEVSYLVKNQNCCLPYVYGFEYAWYQYGRVTWPNICTFAQNTNIIIATAISGIGAETAAIGTALPE